MKIFNTNNTDIITNFQRYFAVELSSNLWTKRVDGFEKTSAECTCTNIFCNIASSVR